MKLFTSLKLILTIHCSEASQLASDALDRELAWDERIALGLHTFVCAACRRWRQQLRDLRQFVSRLPDVWRSNTHDAATIRLDEARRRHIKQLLAEAQRLESN